jgi:uncharacterized protein (DUF488 family)
MMTLRHGLIEIFMTAKTLFTLGYKKLSIDSFIQILKSNKIDLVVDVREKPYSRLRDFSQKRLSAHLDRAGISYIDIKELGAPQKIRDMVKQDGDYQLYFAEYKKHLERQTEALNFLLKLMLENPSGTGQPTICLLCYEKDVSRCHRRVVAERLAALAPSNANIEVVHLSAESS